jgi:hypothetical protein
MGTVLDWAHFEGAIERGARLSERWRVVKYVLLLLILAAALLGFLRPVSDWIGDLSPEQASSQLLVGGGVMVLALGVIVGLAVNGTLFNQVDEMLIVTALIMTGLFGYAIVYEVRHRGRPYQTGWWLRAEIEQQAL